METINKVLNLMNFRVVELFELYTPSNLKGEIDFHYFCSIRKVIFSSIEGHCMVFALYSGKAVIVSNIEENTYTMLEDDGGETHCFDDMILYKGQLYVVDKMGTIFWFHALSFKLVQFSPKNLYCCEENGHIRVNACENKKKLVEYDGSLYVVDLYINDERYYKWGYYLKDVFVEVYKLDQEWGKWLKVKDLGDVSFVLSKDSNFALLAQDYYGFEGNCIYFYFDHKASCFNLKNLETKVADIFWPCPTLFHPVTN
ncbi:hypothetical protein MtrunA17_Chr4g0047461 [Medicago truncatula]|nr:F-box protein At4g35733 [Medicago truncatula]RHN62442.1 hypothetical protein MtrunA17_Chr4g0047461 [Medicago truncatula]